MTEPRGLSDLLYGHVGQVTYVPSTNAALHPGLLHTSRITSNAQHVRVIGSLAELYPPSRTPIPEAPSNLWQERRKQRRWLLQAHPEAFMGNSALEECLEENMGRFHKFEGEVSGSPLFATGQMTDVSDASRVSSASLLAAATGESGELLRLVRVYETRWQWDDNEGTALNLSVIDPDDPEEETIWASDGLPISQIKFATSVNRYDPVRWIIVQKQTSTTILQPIYHGVPVAQKDPGDIVVQQALSRIDPNPVVTLSHKETGSNAHIDVAFNPNITGRPPQLAVMDECGYWSIWDVLGTNTRGKNTTRLSIYKCGHVLEGFLSEIPPIPTYPAGMHGIKFVGACKVDEFWDSQDSKEAQGSATRSDHILLWDREKIEVVNLASKLALPRLSLLKSTRAKTDFIVDVQVSPTNQDHVFVLTTRHLYWINLFPQCGGEEEAEEASPKPLVLIACPHLMDGEDFRMSTSQCFAKAGQDVTMVFTYSPKQKQLHTHWFGHSQDRIPEWHHQTLRLPFGKDAAKSPAEIQCLEIYPVNLVSTKIPAKGPGDKYRRNGVQFYQGSILGKDLSVKYFICASSLDKSMDIVLPTTQLGRYKFKSDQSRRWDKKQRHFVRHLSGAFIFPDGIEDLSMNNLVRRGLYPEALGNPTHLLGQRPMELRLGTLAHAISKTLVASLTNSQRDVSPALISAIRSTIQDGVVEGKLPLTTWKEIEELSPQEPRGADYAAQHDILDLFLQNDGDTIVAHLGRLPTNPALGSILHLSQLYRSFASVWLDPIEARLSEQDQAARRGWIEEIAREVLVTTSGVMVQDVKLFGAGDQEGTQSSQPILSSSIPIKSSQSSGVGIPSSPVSTASVGTSDMAIQRLQLLAPTLRSGKMESAKQSSVLAYWPKERGVSTENYMSSVAIAHDRQFDDARQRLRRIENKRKAHAEKYKLPAFMRQSTSQRERRKADAAELPPLPTPTPAPAQRMQTMSSQQRVPASSQSQGLPMLPTTMSQPVSGMFGDRKKAKKAKRKSGFR